MSETKNEEVKVLTSLGVYRGNTGSEFQYYQLHSQDEEGNKFILTFGIKLHYKESFEKYLGRLVMIAAPTKEQIEEILTTKGTENGTTETN